MNPPDFLILPDEAAYREHYEATLCSSEIRTADGILVRFPKHQFEHAFFESANRRLGEKGLFSLDRARRMTWISPALSDPDAELYEGWDNRKKVHTRDSRACVVFGNYVVIIMLRKRKPASFITAYQASEKTLEKIQSGPKW